MNKHVKLEIDTDCNVTKLLPNEEDAINSTSDIEYLTIQGQKAAFLLGKITGALMAITELIKLGELETCAERVTQLFDMLVNDIDEIYYKNNPSSTL
jgi:hypothetical protein